MAENWTCNSHTKIYEDKHFTVWADEIVPPAEAERIYSYMEHRPAVMIIAVNEHSEYFLVKQYRYPVGEAAWEFPAGGVEQGEDLKEAVKHELQEEIRFAASNITRLGQFNSDSSVNTAICTVFLARDLIPASKERDATEKNMQVAAFRLEEIEEMVRQGQIREGSTLAVLTFLRLFSSPPA